MRFRVSARSGEVSAILTRGDDDRCLLVLGHGAGAGMRHVFMEDLADALAHTGVATFRYQFPYMEQGSRRPNPRPVLLETVRLAVAAAAEVGDGLPLAAGGKSMGGRMTSLAAAVEPLPDVRGLVFVGFPLHPAGKPSIDRAGHLAEVPLPMLFLAGTRDTLAGLDLLHPVCEELGPRATLHVIEGADHGFHVLKRSGRTDRDVLDELGAVTGAWASQLKPC